MLRLSDVCFSGRDQGVSGLNAINVRRPLLTHERHRPAFHIAVAKMGSAPIKAVV
jgi:hypothetical protein